MSVQRDCAFLYDERELTYRFHDDHPFNQQRIRLTVDLLQEAGALHPNEYVGSASATREELLLNHTAEYIEVVEMLSIDPGNPALSDTADRYGLGEGDTPCFEGMHEATSLVVGATLKAAELVMSGQVRHALHLGGGLHHAFPNRGGGFCVYNDAAVAIAAIRRRYGARVLYVDTDVHHGDGVQFSFFGDPNVCTLSIHETGKFLFPGTGFAHERGDGAAFGTAVNIPLEPYTEDDSWMACFETSINRVIQSFKPDVIVSQHGCDAHAYDPLAHMNCSMNIYREMPRLIHRLAHEYCEGRWIALGGGGYDIWRVVPRAWGLLWLEMSGHPLASRIDSDAGLALPPTWIRKWQPLSAEPLPPCWLDRPGDIEVMPRRAAIEEANRRSLEIALQYL
ncbi:acetoin utilization protein AcuC [Paenibacillus thermoaerophilus]|uniref:Acetoin utilization protein AcuC n=1 Tax=Paenibacillus thermoaerophilus TaxID=1215385 RepID=A0ABW2V733_9BACL|nr:acetoin utilization protein AcuC [Paenibacillus thermoaerophilus]TMV18739.1 acetoin utilization protein AcuC [Paenibacillus thermoaerophilus]